MNSTAPSHLGFKVAPIRMSDVRIKIISRLGGESFDAAEMSDLCWPGVSNPNLDATHDFWRLLDKTAAEFGYSFSGERMLYVRGF